jgi:hypothetical protein
MAGRKFGERSIESRDNPALGFTWLPSLRGELLGEFVRVSGVLERLFAEFVSAQMVSFTMGDRSGGVRVGRNVVELYDSIVRTLRHTVSPANSMLPSGTIRP